MPGYHKKANEMTPQQYVECRHKRGTEGSCYHLFAPMWPYAGKSRRELFRG